ncbi:MAG: hypothetical protein LQ340_006458 [Diploschistes diacapsis]|nr:MAG: hypothetical protein LQ340_006458 [Diploschistes diacapsis]
MALQNAQVVFEGSRFHAVREGAATILNSLAEKENGAPELQRVFYNPIQQFNRDLSVLAIRVFAEDLATIRKQRHGTRRGDAEKSNKKRKRSDDDDNDGQSLAEDQPRLKVTKIITGSTSNPSGSEGRVTEAIDASSDKKTLTNGTISHIDASEPNTERQPVLSDQGNQVQAEVSPTRANDNVPTSPKASNAASAHVGPQIRVLDALSATGLRALRYAKEVPELTSVTANDLSPSATEAIAVNARYNELESRIEISTGDALVQLHRNRGRYEVIDLDPYGTAAPFLDAAVQGLTNGGLLCVTCTDSAVFASTGYPEKTFSQYGGTTAKGPQSHEAGLRLVLQSIASSAARYGLAVEPLLSLSIDFYVRVFVKLRRSPKEVKLLASKTMVVYNCDSGCGAWTKQFMARTKHKENKKGDPVLQFSLAQAPTASPTCEHCGFKTHLAGPMWGGPIQNPYFIQRVLDILPNLSTEIYGTIPRIEGMLTTARDETLLPPTAASVSAPESVTDNPKPHSPYPLLRIPPEEPDHHPFFFMPSTLARTLRSEAPSSNALRGALLGLKYRVTRAHTKAGSIRTDAPWSVIWEVMREWVRQASPIKEGVLPPGTAGFGIMQKDRSKLRLNNIKGDLSELAQNATGVAEMKTRLESLLWRLNGSEEGTAEGPHGPAEALSKQPNQKSGNKTLADRGSQVFEAGDGDVCLPELKVEFNETLGREDEEKRRLVRYQHNPRANWGPMTRAKG